MANLRTVALHVDNAPKEMSVNGNVYFINSDIDAAVTLDPFTHIYMFDVGFPPALQKSIARKFNRSLYAEYLISYRAPYLVVNQYGYDVEFMEQFSTSMHGKCL
jgi:hypothetical protein